MACVTTINLPTTCLHVVDVESWIILRSHSGSYLARNIVPVAAGFVKDYIASGALMIPGFGLWRPAQGETQTEVGLEGYSGSKLVETWPLLSVLGDFPMVRLSSGSIVARKSDSRPSPPNRDYPKPSGHCTHSPSRMCLHGHGMSKPRRQGEGSELNWVQTS